MKIYKIGGLNGNGTMKATIMMVMVQIAIAAVNMFYKLAADDGMNLKIIIAYRFLFASALVSPLAFFLERNKRPKLTCSILFYAFLSGFFGGSLIQNIYVQTQVLTSATFASAMGNLVPAITFIMAISFRLEKLNVRTMGGKAKVLGTLVIICGSMFLTFYKGVEIKTWSTHFDLFHGGQHKQVNNNNHDKLIGSLLAFGGCFSSAIWLIIQAKMSECYPCDYSSSALMCIMGSIQATSFALCFERQWTQWKLGWNIRLLSVAYTGMVTSGLTISIMSWCVRHKGPLFLSAFKPIGLILVAIYGSLLMEEKLYMGWVVGAVMIICGLYILLWGKSREMKRVSELRIEDIEDLSISSPLPKTTIDILESSKINRK